MLLTIANYSETTYSGTTYILPKHKKISIRKHNHCMLKNFEELLVSQKPLYMCLQCVRCRWVGWKAKTKTASNQSKNLTKFSEIKKIRKKKIQQENFSSLKNCTLEVEVNFYLHLAYLKARRRIKDQFELCLIKLGV